jgi:hypothetical protein
LEHRKIKIAVVISIISVLIAISSLAFSIYVGVNDVKYKEDITRIQQIGQDLQRKGLEFDENYRKISLVEQSIAEQMNNCNNINENELNKDLKLLIYARSALIKNDYVSSSAYLTQVNADEICIEEISPRDYSIYWFIGILAVVWIVLIIAFFRVIGRRK